MSQSKETCTAEDVACNKGDCRKGEVQDRSEQRIETIAGGETVDVTFVKVQASAEVSLVGAFENHGAGGVFAEGGFDA